MVRVSAILESLARDEREPVENVRAPGTFTHEEWMAEGKRRFGCNRRAWRFVCPMCGRVASVGDWMEAGAPDCAIAFVCIGRWNRKSECGACNYAASVPCANLVTVTDLCGGASRRVFAFASKEA